MARRGTERGGLTERDRFWLGHLERQAAGSETSKAYAAREQLSIFALYQARKRLIALGAWSVLAPACKRRRPQSTSAPQFTRLALLAPAPIAASAVACRLRLADGVVIEWSAAPAADLLAELAVRIAAPR